MLRRARLRLVFRRHYSGNTAAFSRKQIDGACHCGYIIALSKNSRPPDERVAQRRLPAFTGSWSSRWQH
jgi:hypothetical protein